MAREIHCTACGTYLGSLTKAHLSKDIAYLCGECESRRRMGKWADHATMPPGFAELFGRGK
jgi:hypothetical protein